jgi:hypothetical protein
MGQTTGTGCRIPDAPPMPAGEALGTSRGRCWQVDVHRWSPPGDVAFPDNTLAR